MNASTQGPRIGKVTYLSNRYMYNTNNNTKRTSPKLPAPSVQADIITILAAKCPPKSSKAVAMLMLVRLILLYKIYDHTELSISRIVMVKVGTL